LIAFELLFSDFIDPVVLAKNYRWIKSLRKYDWQELAFSFNIAAEAFELS